MNEMRHPERAVPPRTIHAGSTWNDKRAAPFSDIIIFDRRHTPRCPLLLASLLALPTRGSRHHPLRCGSDWNRGRGCHWSGRWGRGRPRSTITVGGALRCVASFGAGSSTGAISGIPTDRRSLAGSRRGVLCLWGRVDCRVFRTRARARARARATRTRTGTRTGIRACTGGRTTCTCIGGTGGGTGRGVT